MSFDYSYVLPPTGPAENQIVREMFDDIRTYVNALANTALSNLASVAINTTLVSDAHDTDDLGTTSVNWRTLYLGTSLVIQESGAGTDAITIVVPSSITAWTFTLPPDNGDANEVLTTDGSGVTTWEPSTGLVPATQTEMESASSNTVGVTPSVAIYHPGTCKAWVKFNNAGTISADYNVSSVTDSSASRKIVALDITLSSTNYSVGVTQYDDTTFTSYTGNAVVTDMATTSYEIGIDNETNYDGMSSWLFGDI